MKKRWGNWSIGLGLLALTAGLALGWQVNAAALFSDDFEDGNSNGWSKSGGSWSVVADGSKVYKQTSTSSNAYSYTGTSSWGGLYGSNQGKAVEF